MSKELKEKLSKILEEHGSELGENGVKSIAGVVDSIEVSKSSDFVFADYLTEHFKSSESKFKHSYVPGIDPANDEFEYKREIGCLPLNDEIRKQYALPNLPGIQRKDFSPTKGELTKINEMTGRPYEKEELKVYPVVFWDAEYDSHLERFSLKATKEGKRLAIGAPGIKDHDVWKSDGVFGRVFDAEVIQQDGGHYLIGKIFMLNTPENKAIIDGFESSINCEISVGVRGKRDEYICDVCDRAMYKFSADPKDIWCGHYTGQRLPGNKVVTATINGVSFFKEWSRVVRGAQRAARVRTKTDSSINSDGSENGVIQKSDSTSTLFPNSGSEEIEVEEVLKALKEMQEKQSKFEEKIDKEIGAISQSVSELKKASEANSTKPQDPPAQPSDKTEQPPAVPTAPVAQPATTEAAKTDSAPAAPVVSSPAIAPAASAEVDAQKAHSDRLQLLEDIQKANVEMTKGLQEQNQQIVSQLDVMAKAYTALTAQCTELVKTSQDSITADLANFRTEKMRAVEQEVAHAEHAKKDGGVGAAMTGFVGALTNFGEKK